MLNMAVLAPIPRARVSTAINVKPGLLPKHPQAKAQILHQILQVANAARVAAIFFGQFDAAEFAPGFATCIIDRQPAGEVFLRFLLEVILQLLA